MSAGLAGAAGPSDLVPSVGARATGPIDVTGRETIYDSQTDSFIVRGNAVMTQGGSVLKADEIEVTRRDRTAHAKGHVHLIDPQIEMWAKEARVNLKDETLELYDAKVVARDRGYHIEGKRISKLVGQNYAVTKGFFTTCNCGPGAPDWSITAERMEVEVGSGGVARGGSLNVKGFPVLPLPFLKFPADTDRHSGFLVGRIGQSGLRGIQYLQPFFWAINKSSDATVALDVETLQRVGLLAEYRLTNGEDDYFWIDGAFYDESLRSDSNRGSDIVDDEIASAHIPLNRYGIIAKARQHLAPNLILYGDTVSVSDSLYLREMNVSTLSHGFGTNFGSRREATSRFGLLSEFDNGFARLEGTFNQDLIQSQRFALQRLPQLLISGRRQLAGGLAYTDYDVEAVNFWRRAGVRGYRLDLNPRVTVPWRFGEYVYGHATVGMRGTIYNTSGHNVAIAPAGTGRSDFNNQLSVGALSDGGVQARGVPWARVGISSVLEKVYELDWSSVEKIKHTIEPFVNYSYVPGISQGGLPLFDQVDRIRPRSLLTYGFISRIFARMPMTDVPEEQNAAELSPAGAPLSQPHAGGAQTRHPRLSAALAPSRGNTYSRGSQVRELMRLSFSQAYDTTQEVSLGGGQISDLQTSAVLFPTSMASAGGQVSYNPRSHAGVTNASAFLTLHAPRSESKRARNLLKDSVSGSFFQLAYTYVNPRNAAQSGRSRNGSQFISARAYGALLDRLGIYVAPSYDFAARRLLSIEYGVRIKSPCDCWAFDFGLTDTFNPDEVQFQFQLTLGGLGAIGRSPLTRNPFGFGGLGGRPLGVLSRY